MQFLLGPRLYYSLFGPLGLILGAVARVPRYWVQVGVKIPAIVSVVFLRLRTTDVMLAREIFLNGQYAVNLSDTPRVIVDAGANIGLSAVLFANRFPGARIVAIEPEPSNYELLKKNAAPYGQIETFRAALWDKCGTVGIFDSGMGNSAFQTKAATPSSGGKHTAKSVTLDRLIADCGIEFVDFLKVDVEGAEVEIFRQAGAWIDKIGAVGVELHDWLRNGCRQAVLETMANFQYEWQKGETTYFARVNNSDVARSEAVSVEDRPFGKPDKDGLKHPFRIVHYEISKNGIPILSRSRSA